MFSVQTSILAPLLYALLGRAIDKKNFDLGKQDAGSSLKAKPNETPQHLAQFASSATSRKIAPVASTFAAVAERQQGMGCGRRERIQKPPECRKTSSKSRTGKRKRHERNERPSTLHKKAQSQPEV
uniref:Uncharacterized protein n=1 Tax=Ixodes ricinus TaxID=34613 RepID=A0A147BNC6_IXORI